MTGAGDQSESAGTSPLVQELLARMAERVPASRLPAVREFARAYVRRISPDLVPGLNAEELFGQVMGAFDLADGRGSAPLAVRVFNPTLADDGYQTVGTVVETNCEDMPFLVDSVSEELSARGLDVRLVNHPVIGTERDADGRIRRVMHAREAPVRESVMHFEVSRHLAPEELRELEARIRLVLGDVQAAVRDHEAMRARVPQMIDAARSSTARYALDEIEEARAFLEWLLDGNFVLLGYREYALADGKLSIVPGAGLGILADDARSRYATPVPVSAIEPDLRERLVGGNLLVVSKTNRFATVHRHAKMDDITVKRVDERGNTVALLRLLGIFTRKAYMEPAGKTPILGRKLRQIAVAEDLLEGSHDHKALVALFESFPKDELFAAGPDELRETLVRLLDLQERRHIQLFVRPHLDEDRVSVMVALPRDRFNAELRHRLQDLVVQRFNGSSVDYHLSLGDEDQARIHFTIHVDGAIPDVSFAELEQEVVAVTRTWDDRLRERLVALHGEETRQRPRRQVREAPPRLLQVVHRRVPRAPRHRAVRAARARRGLRRRAAERARPGAEPHPHRALQERAARCGSPTSCRSSSTSASRSSRRCRPGSTATGTSTCTTSASSTRTASRSTCRTAERGLRTRSRRSGAARRNPTR